MQEYDKIHKILLDGISDNMTSLAMTDKYGANTTTDTTTMGFYAVKYMSYAFTLQQDITTNGQLFKAVEMDVRAIYIRSMK